MKHFLIIFSVFCLTIGAISTCCAQEKVTFTISINIEDFLETTPIIVTVKNAADLQAEDQNSLCEWSYDGEAQQEINTCPEGVEYIPLNPEKFSIDPQEVGLTIDVSTQRVKLNEAYHVRVAGITMNGVKLVAEFEGVAGNSLISLNKEAWDKVPMPMFLY